MALINCPECGHQVSDQAKTCPHCGIEIAGRFTAPLTDKPQLQQRPSGRKRSWIAWLVALILALIMVCIGFWYYQRTQQENELRAYENAIRSSEPAVLQNFLDVYADATQAHRDSIEWRLHQLKQVDKDWTHAVLSGSKAELERYMKLYPSSVHIVEAQIKIDSLDWLTAMQENTAEAYQTYIKAHEDGAHYDEALAKFERLEAAKVNTDDKRVIAELFATYFTALAKIDEVNLSLTLPPVLNSFLHKANATKSDVIQYMNRIHEPDVLQMQFILNNDWKIQKAETEDGQYDYTVEFSVDQKMDRSDESKERFVSYKVQAKVSPEYKITDLNMKKIVQ